VGEVLPDKGRKGGVVAKEEFIQQVSLKGKSCLVGKLMVERIVGKKMIKKGTLIRGWKPMGFLIFKVLGENTFLIEFEYEWDKLRVLEGRPWIFNGNLFSVVDYNRLSSPNEMACDSKSFWVRMFQLPLFCMGREMGNSLGSTMGEVKEVDTNEKGIG
jgi:hypothetical protein